MTIVAIALQLLQAAYAALIFVQVHPELPEWQKVQAISMANQAIATANQALQQPAPGNPSYAYGIQIVVAGNDGFVDTVRSGYYYQVVWTPFDPSQGLATVELVNTGTGGVTMLGTAMSNTINWPVSAGAGSYRIRITQSGRGVIGERSLAIY